MSKAKSLIHTQLILIFTFNFQTHKHKLMSSIIIISKEDFDQFKKELVDEIRQIIQPDTQKKDKWLRSSDVREMLNISDSTLQTFRINGTIPAYKLDSTWFYKYDEIVDALEKGRNR